MSLSLLRFRMLFGFLGLAVFADSLRAVDPPGLISHQGRIAVDGVNYTGTGYFKFVLHNGSATTLWSNDGSSFFGVEPDTALSVPVTNGHYALNLGESAAIPETVFTES